MSDEIRYTGNSINDKVLRLALLTVWDNTCYWCGKPRDFNEVEIDHIIHRKIQEDDLKAVLKELLRGDPALEEKYNVDAPANLAPICAPCNREKADISFKSGPFEVRFKKARAKASKVEKWVRSFKSSHPVAKAVVTLATADLDDARAKRSLANFAPVLDSRIRHLNYVTEGEHFNPFEDETQQATLSIDERGRRTIVLLEDFHGMDLDNALLPAIRRTRSSIEKHLASDMETNVRHQGHVEPEAGTLLGDIDIRATALRYDRSAEQYEISGSFDAVVEADVWVTDLNGSRDETVQEMASSRGTFAASFPVDPLDASEIYVTIRKEEAEETTPEEATGT